MTRKEIEDSWLEDSEVYNGGEGLCITFGEVGLVKEWGEVWRGSKRLFISGYFIREDSELYFELSYLTRALSLHMLLDDCGIE